MHSSVRSVVLVVGLGVASPACAQSQAPPELRDRLLELARAEVSAATVVQSEGAGPVVGALEAMARAGEPSRRWALRQLGDLAPERAKVLAGEALDANPVDPAVAEVAARIVGAAKVLSAGPRLAQLTDRGYPKSLRLAAVAALGQLDGSVAATLLALLSEDADPDVREGAARALGAQGLAEHAASLAAALERDGAVAVRAAAAEALGKVRGETAWGALLRHVQAKLAEPDLATLTATRALGRFEARAVPEFGKLLDRARDEAFVGELMASMCPARRSATLPRFANKDNALGPALAGSKRFLEGSRDARLREDLLDVACFYTRCLGLEPDSPEPAARALQQALRAALSDRSLSIRRTAYAWLPLAFRAEARNLLARGLADRDLMIRIDSAVGVEALGDGEAARSVLEAEWGKIVPDDPRRGEVLSAGAKMQGPRLGLQRLAVDALQTTISLPVIAAAARLLKDVPRESLHPGARDAAQRMLASEDPGAQSVAADLLKALDAPVPSGSPAPSPSAKPASR